MITKVINVVATASFDRRIDLKELARSFTNVSYNPEKYHCAYFRSNKIHGTVSIFSSGSIISIGAKSERDAKTSLIHVAKELGKKGFGILEESSVKTQNIVLCADVRKPIHLESLAMSLKRAIYEPDEFPALIVPNKGVTYLIFNSGKIICTGLKTMAQLEEVTHFIGTISTGE